MRCSCKMDSEPHAGEMERNKSENQIHPLANSQIPLSHHPRRAPGGWKAIRYILANETFEKLASMSLIANLIVYVHTKYNLDSVVSADLFNIWSGTTNIAPLAGAFLADAYLGRFRTLFIGTIASLLGMIAMTLTASISQLRPSTCPTQLDCQKPTIFQLGFLYLALGLIAIGSGGIRPCNIAFGADQFDTTTEKGRAQLESFCNWWYFLFTAALIVALTLVVYVQTNVSWIAGFALPSGCFVFSITFFLWGRHTYIYMKPEGSVFSSMVKVFTAAYRKRGIKRRELDSDVSFYDPPKIGEEPQPAKLSHTDRFTCLDQAAIISDTRELDAQGKAKNGWKLCSLHQVEQLKCILGLVPVWLSGIVCFIAMLQMNSFGILQAIQTDRHIGKNFQIPPAWLGLAPMITLSLWIYIYEKIYLPVMQRRTKKEKRLSLELRITTGIVLSIICMVVSGIVEKVRRDLAFKKISLNMAVLIPQFAISGLIEAFAAIAMMEFLTTQSPDSMRTVAGAVFFLSLSLASYLSSILIRLVNFATSVNGNTSWLGQNDINKNRLDNFYYTIAALGSLNLLYFYFFARRYLSNGNGRGRRSRESVEGEQTKEEKGMPMVEMP